MSDDSSSGLSSPSRTALGIGLGIALLLLCSAAYMLISRRVRKRRRRKHKHRHMHKHNHIHRTRPTGTATTSSAASSARPLMPDCIPLAELPRRTSLVISKPSSVYSSSSPRGARSLALDIERRDSDAGMRKAEAEMRRQQDVRDVLDMYRATAVRGPQRTVIQTEGMAEGTGTAVDERLKEFRFPFARAEGHGGSRGKGVLSEGDRGCPTLKEWPG